MEYRLNWIGKEEIPLSILRWGSLGDSKHAEKSLDGMKRVAI